jgi:hypothetical protein
MRSLLEQRTPLYSQADLHITEREGDTPEDVAQRSQKTSFSLKRLKLPNFAHPQDKSW